LSETVSEKVSDTVSETGRQKRTRPRPRPPSELELLEREIEAQETAVAELEGRLAEDWGDLDTLTAHRRARDELQRLLARWEQLFEVGQGGGGPKAPAA
jgi:hypothetical protein